MKLFTKTQYDQLIKNGNNRDEDHTPVVKLFMTGTGCTWLISGLDPEYPDFAFGLCDLGQGFPELGTVSITEILEAQSVLIMLERDKLFEGKYPLSVYASAARSCGYVTTDLTILERFSKR